MVCIYCRIAIPVSLQVWPMRIMDALVIAMYIRIGAWAGCVAYLGWVGNAKACVLGISKKQTPAPFFVYDYPTQKLLQTAESEESISTYKTQTT